MAGEVKSYSTILFKKNNTPQWHDHTKLKTWTLQMAQETAMLLNLEKP